MGSRGSALAQAQSRLVMEALEARYPQVRCTLHIFTSRGDQFRDRPIRAIGGSGVFTRELEQALLDGEIDLAIHSMKDLPARQPDGLMLAPTPQRADPRDVLVLGAGMKGWAELPQGALLGTGSPRRAAQLALLRPDIQALPIRGNVDTRLRRAEEDLDGVVLAAAGLERLGLAGRISAYFSPQELIPAPAQGALALELRQGDEELLRLLEGISHRESALAVRAERAFLLTTGAGCHAPVGAWCQVEGERLTLWALYGREDSLNVVRGSATGGAKDPEELGKRLALELQEHYREEWGSET